MQPQAMLYSVYALHTDSAYPALVQVFTTESLARHCCTAHTALDTSGTIYNIESFEVRTCLDDASQSWFDARRDAAKAALKAYDDIMNANH